MLKTGKGFELIYFVILLVATVYYLWSSIQGKIQKLRILPQIDAISDGIDRAVEMGKPVLVSPGNLAYLSGMYAGMTIAGMNVFRYVTHLCVRKGARVLGLVPTNSEVQPLMDGMFQEAALMEGKPEAYRSEDIRYFGNTYSAFGGGSLGLIAEEGCGCFIMVGAMSSAGSSGMGAAKAQDALVITGSARWGMQGTFSMFSDYYIPLEDIFTFGAICSDDNVVKSSLVGGDIAKIVLVGIIILFSILAIGGLPTVNWLSGI